MRDRCVVAVGRLRRRQLLRVLCGERGNAGLSSQQGDVEARLQERVAWEIAQCDLVVQQLVAAPPRLCQGRCMRSTRVPGKGTSQLTY